MKIAQIAPLYESVPPKYYGGSERIVSYLTDELVRLGHDVTLFASGDSVTEAKLAPQCPRALRLDKNSVDQIVHHVLMIERVFQHAQEFDIIHSHIDYFPFSLIRRSPVPVLTTLHGRLDLPDLKPLYQEFSDMPVISISDAQREPIPNANWKKTVYHGLPGNVYKFHDKPQGYLAFMGRISPEKRVDRAIKIAKRVNMTLKIAAKVDKVDEAYFKSTIEPLLGHPLIEYIGEIGESEKIEFLGNASALLFPIDWPEPFGLVMIEAMSCGTPVIARCHGSVPEVIKEGVTGYIVDNIEEAVHAVGKALTLDRKTCHELFEERFTATRMAKDYLEVYEQLIREKKHA